MMRLIILPDPEQLVDDGELLQEAIIKVLFRFGPLTASITSSILRVEEKVVQEAVRKLEESHQIRMDKKMLYPIAVPEELVAGESSDLPQGGSHARER